LFLALIAAVNLLGSYDPITPAVPQAQTAMMIGGQATSWLGASLKWIFGLTLGAIGTGIGWAMFGEARKACRLWQRQAQAGRWNGGPNANWQRQPSTPRLSKQDMLLLALSGRLPQGERPAVTYQAPAQADDDLFIEM
jgi:hypothetical protein